MNIVRKIPLPPHREAAFALQTQLAKQLDLRPGPTDVKTIAAADVAYAEGKEEAYAGVVLLERSTGKILEKASWVGVPTYPYQSGLFAFREAPCVLAAFEKLQTRPDAIMIDSQGIAHPRGFGLACHIGLALDLPTIGCAKTLLCGESGDLGSERGDTALLHFEGKVIGQVVRTQTNIKPIYVSPGHRYDLASAVALALDWAPQFRIPEPLRAAHHLSIELRAAHQESSTAPHV